MPHDDRDRNFEKALARNLQAPAPRSVVPAGTAPSELDSRSTPIADCPGAEILAAYHERLLAPDEMISRKRHIAACPRCQAILAQLEFTDEVPLDAHAEEFVPAAALPAPVFAQVARAARPVSSPSSYQTLSKSSAAVEMPRRSPSWRWLAPAGALAAALLIWVAVRESHPPQFELAKNQQQPVPANLPPPAPPPASSVLQSSTAANAEVSSSMNGDRLEKDSALRHDRATLGQKKSPSLAMKAAAPRSRPAGAATNSAEPSRDQLTAEAAPPIEMSKEKALAKTLAPLAPAVLSASATPSATDNLAVIPSAPKLQARAKNDTPVGELSAAPPLQVQASNAGAFAPRETVTPQARSLVSVTSPDGTVTWRLGPGGIIQHSANQAANWTLQKTGVVADLLAGSAVSNKVCWVTGRSGTILRTTDGGNRWRTVSSPTTEDIASVFAIDDRQATIITASELYSTVNAGKTWTPHPKP